MLGETQIPQKAGRVGLSAISFLRFGQRMFPLKAKPQKRMPLPSLSQNLQ